MELKKASKRLSAKFHFPLGSRDDSTEYPANESPRSILKAEDSKSKLTKKRKKRKRGPNQPETPDDASLPTEPPLAPEAPLRLRFLLLGSPHSGKKCLAYKFVEGTFKGDCCGSEVPIKEKTWGSSVYQIAIAWDNKDVTMCQYTDSHVVLICFDFTSRESYTEACMKWFREAKTYKCRRTIFLVGLKLDCTSNRMVTWDEVQNFCTENGIECFSCSASTGEGIEEIFHTSCLLLKKLINEGEVEYICEYW